MKKGNAKALIPIGVFLVLYLGLGILFEYVLKIQMGFYNIPIVVAFLAALLVACLQNKGVSFDGKLEIMGRGVGDKDIFTMILIFLAAGIFVGVVGRESAESVAYFMLSLIPAEYSVAVLFVVSCFVSLAMGTSVGTITLITPIAVAVSGASGFDASLCIATVIGGSMFGDNLSFISDTTIAACNGQGCQMKDKFKENFFIALPAAIVSLIFILVLSLNTEIEGAITKDYNLVQIIPYILVLIGGIVGINVFAVLLTGIVSGAAIMLLTGSTKPVALLASMGKGADGMFETIIVTILVSALCALIREYGGFDALLWGIKKVFRGKKGGQVGMGFLVGALDIATANNTVAIVMANPIAREIADDYGISERKAASILDTFSCVFQAILPYGAQMLVALSAASALGISVSALEIIPLLFYPYLLLVSSLIAIAVGKKQTKGESMKKTTYLFDFDGTLVDSMPSWMRKVLNILDKSGVSYPDDIIKIITPLGDLGTAKYFRDVLGVEMTLDEMFVMMDEYALPKYRDEIILKEGVFDYLTALRKKGASLNVLTASPHKMLDPCLKRNGIYDLFDNVWSSDDFGLTKSNPEIYREVARRLGKDEGEIAFFDDNIGAVRTASEAGLFTVAVFDESAKDFTDEIKTVADLYVESFEHFSADAI